MLEPSSIIYNAVAVQADDIEKSYENKLKALDKIHFKLYFGKVVGLVGNNGSGKTTLLKILGGLIPPDKGRIKWSRGKGLTIGYLSQEIALDPDLSGKDILRLFGKLYGIQGALLKKSILSLSKELGLEEHFFRPVKSYSGGLRQRLHLAVTLLSDPSILLIDEPTSSLDPGSQDYIWKVIQRYASENKAVCVVSHDLRKVASYCHLTALLHGGRLKLCDTPQAIISTYGTIQNKQADLTSAFFNLTGYELKG